MLAAPAAKKRGQRFEQTLDRLPLVGAPQGFLKTRLLLRRGTPWRTLGQGLLQTHAGAELKWPGAQGIGHRGIQGIHGRPTRWAGRTEVRSEK